MGELNCVIIMGAAVKDDGIASGALLRRINSALMLFKVNPDIFFLVTGGIGKNKFSETRVMKKILLDSGIDENNIIMDEHSNDTLASIINCTELLNKTPSFDTIFICSDIYHIPRCRWLFYLLGIKTKSFKVISGLKPNGINKWLYYYIRELAAFPYDTVLMLFYKVRMLF